MSVAPTHDPTHPARQASQDELTQEDKLLLVRCLEVGIQRGKLRPYEAIRLANKLSLFVPGWVKEQADHYARTTPTPPGQPA